MAAAAGKKSTTSLSLFMETFGLEVEEELSTMATQYWAEGVWMGKWHHEQREAWMKQIQELQLWKQVRKLAEAVMCETRDLGGYRVPFLAHLDIRRRQKHRYEICLPKSCEENASAASQKSLLEEVGSKA